MLFVTRQQLVISISNSYEHMISYELKKRAQNNKHPPKKNRQEAQEAMKRRRVGSERGARPSKRSQLRTWQ